MHIKPILPLLLLASLSFAGDGELDERYHQAYALEVVEGKVQEAARIYLELLKNDKLPKEIAVQCKFRFAVTCVLLGRPDEARARLTALLADPQTPVSLRPQIEEYRKAAGGIRPGRALDDKLQSLVFELGRTRLGGGKTPAVYKDFEIIGDPAVPVLKGLLKRPSGTLPQHAFRILCRLNAKDFVEAWQPNWDSDVFIDLVPYLKRHVDIQTRMIPKIAAAGANVLRRGHSYLRQLFLPPALLREMAKVQNAEHDVVDYVRAAVRTPENVELVVEWMKKGRPALAQNAALLYVEWCTWKDPEVLFDAKLLPQVLRPWSNMYLSFKPNAKRGLRQYLTGIPVRAVVQAALPLKFWAWSRGQKDRPGEVSTATLGLFCRALERDDASPAEVRDYERLLRSWMKQSLSSDPRTRTWLAPGVSWVLHRLPKEAAAKFMEEVYVPHGVAGAFGRNLGFGSTRSLELQRMALGRVPADQRSEILRSLEQALGRETKLSPERDRLLGRLMPEFAQYVNQSTTSSFGGMLRSVANRLTAEEARTMIFGIARTLADRPPNLRSGVLRYAFYENPNTRVRRPDVHYLRDVAVPVILKLGPGAVDEDIVYLAYGAIGLLNDPDRLGIQKQAPALAEFLIRNTKRIGHTNILNTFVSNPHLFPLERWVPHLSRRRITSGNLFARVQPSALDSAAQKMVETGDITEATVRFLANRVSPKVREALFDGILLKGDPNEVHLVIGAKGHMAASVKAVSSALDSLMKSADANLADCAALAQSLAEDAPSKDLFPVVRRLLGASDTDVVETGVDIAKSLGQEELIPALMDKLTSMKSRIRTKAKRAIDSILALRRLRSEVETKLRGNGAPKDK